MNMMVTNLLACAVLLCTFILVTDAAQADTDTIADTEKAIQSDIDALHKDSEALKRDMEKLNEDRAAKAAAKAREDTTGQAKASVAIGVDHAKINEKQAEKKVDQKILEHHKAQLDEQINHAAKATSPADQD